MKEKVLEWLHNGASIAEGAIIFSQIAGSDHPLNRVLVNRSRPIKYALKITLCRLVGIDYSQPLPEKVQIKQPEKVSLREEWPFLRADNCPPELKILTSNKITAYHNYLSAHDKLFDCNSAQEQFTVVRDLIENYIENRQIIKEFEFYKKHGRILGQHEIFQQLKELRKLRDMKLLDLVKLKKKLEHNIWRIQSEISKADKPHLDLTRKNQIKQKRIQLAEIERILIGYE